MVVLLQLRTAVVVVVGGSLYMIEELHMLYSES